MPATEPHDAAHSSTRSRRAMAESDTDQFGPEHCPERSQHCAILDEASARKGSKHSPKGSIKATSTARLYSRFRGEKNKVFAD